MPLDEPAEYGVERMDEEVIDSFLANRPVGVLGLPTERLPYMIPISFGYDGEETRYFGYVVGEVSQKALVSDETSVASFLVFDAHSETLWTSVALAGPVSRVPDDELDDVEAALESTSRPRALERADESSGSASTGSGYRTGPASGTRRPPRGWTRREEPEQRRRIA